VAEIQNQHQTLIFDVKHGLLQKVTNTDGSMNAVGDEIEM
jgi:alpha-mannosidase II